MLKYPPRLPLAQLPTPLQPLRRLQRREGGPLIWLKRDDMTGATLSGNKVRKLEFILAQAQLDGFDAVITCGGYRSCISYQVGIKECCLSCFDYFVYQLCYV